MSANNFGASGPSASGTAHVTFTGTSVTVSNSGTEDFGWGNRRRHATFTAPAGWRFSSLTISGNNFWGTLANSVTLWFQVWWNSGDDGSTPSSQSTLWVNGTMAGDGNPNPSVVFALVQQPISATVPFHNSQTGLFVRNVTVSGMPNTNQMFVLPADTEGPTPPTGYTFSHWTNTSVTRNIGSGGTLARHYITPNFVRHAVTATFHLNGGGIEDNTTTYQILFISGSHVPQPRNPVRLGFAFAGWFTTAGGDTLFDFTAARSENQTIHAQWEPLTGNVVMLRFAGGLRVEDTVWAFNPDRQFTMRLPSAGYMNEFPPAFGQIFLGWYTNPEFTGTPQYRVQPGATGPQEFFGRWS